MKNKIIILVVAMVAIATASPYTNRKKSSRQVVPTIPAVVVGQEKEVTLVKLETPSVVSSVPPVEPLSVAAIPAVPAASQAPAVPATPENKPELVPTVVEASTTARPPQSPAPAQRPGNATATGEDEDEESSEEEEDNEEADDDDNEEEEEEEDDENTDDSENNEEEDQRKLKKNTRRVDQETYIPGYITEEGELLVPIDTVQRDLQYTIIPDPNFRNNFHQKGRKVNVPTKKATDSLKAAAPARAAPAPIPQSEESTDSDELAEKIGTKTGPGSIVFKKVESSSASSEEEDEPVVVKNKPAVTAGRPNLAAVPSRTTTNEDDELEAKNARRRSHYFHNNNNNFQVFY